MHGDRYRGPRKKDGTKPVRTLIAVLMIIAMAAVLGCTQASEPIYVTATPHPRAATETANARAENERQVRESVMATVAATVPTVEPASVTQTKVAEALVSITTEDVPPTAIPHPGTVINTIQSPVAPTPTKSPTTYGGENCDQLLRNQLVFQRGATNAGRMQEVIRQIQAQRDNCVPDLWSPVVDDATAVLATGCHNSVVLPMYTNPLVNRIGNLTIPEGLYTGFTTTDTVRATSGRDSDNNIIVYWSDTAGQTPADGAKCWLYVSRLNNWDENFGEEYRTEERTEREPVHYTRVASPDDIEETIEGEWYYIEVDEEGLYVRMITMVTPGERLTTSYGCVTVKQMEITAPIVRIGFTNRLPMELITREESLQVQTIAGGTYLPLEWMTSLTQDTDIKLTEADSQTLVQHIDATNAENYQIIFPHNPELDRVIPVKGLGTVVKETGLACFTDEIKDPELQPLMPPGTPQDPRDGRYTYTSPDQRFTFEYPADCGQMWESAANADNSEACPGDLKEINTWVETVNFAGIGGELSESPEWFTKDHVDKMTARFENTSRYDLVTNRGHKLEVVEIEADEGYGLATIVAAAFTDSEWYFITIYMAYWSETSAVNQERAKQALRTFVARYT